MFSGILYTAFLYINTSSVYGRERKVISNQIKELLESRANIMVSDRTILHENYFKSKYANVVEERQRNQIVKFRDKMKESGETYSSARTDITIVDSEKISDSIVSMKIKEETYLKIAETETETGYDAEQNSMTAMIASICLYIAFVLISAVGTILAVQSLSDSTKYKYRYSTLRRIGVNDKTLFRTIKKQLLILFGVPTVYSIICGFFMVVSMNNIFQILLQSKYSYLAYKGIQ